VPLAALAGVVLTAVAQELPASTAPSTAPAEHISVLARVIEVHGDVQHSPLGSADWQPCRVGDEYPEQTVIRTGVRSSVKLQIGDEEPYTAAIIDPASKTILTECFKTAQTKRTRIGVGYGRVRAGVAEGGLKSEFTIDTPVATLSKRGTWNFGIFYERATDRFEVFLLDRGLVEALNEITGQRRILERGQAVTEAMRRWLDEAQIRRNVPIPDLLGQGDLEVAFNRLRLDGLGVTDPAGGWIVLIDLSDDLARQEFARLIQAHVGPSGAGLGQGPFLRAEGFFGTGRGDQLIPVIIEAGSPLAQKGWARPGTYNFRRSALEQWFGQRARQP